MGRLREVASKVSIDRVLVCGSREWTDDEIINTVLEGVERYLHAGAPFTVISGGARGADSFAAEFGKSEPEYQTRRSEVYEAEWGKHGKAAGPIRNQRMLDEGKPQLVLAFGQGRGTDDMVRRAVRAGLPVYRILNESDDKASSA